MHDSNRGKKGDWSNWSKSVAVKLLSWRWNSVAGGPRWQQRFVSIQFLLPTSKWPFQTFKCEKKSRVAAENRFRCFASKKDLIGNCFAAFVCWQESIGKREVNKISWNKKNAKKVTLAIFLLSSNFASKRFFLAEEMD